MVALVKHLHVWLVILSVASFALRLIWTQKKSEYLKAKSVRIAAPAVDALLLITGFLLAGLLGLSPFTTSWLGLKLLAILIYVLLATITLRVPLPRMLRNLSGSCVIVTVMFIIFLSVYKPAF